MSHFNKYKFWVIFLIFVVLANPVSSKILDLIQPFLGNSQIDVLSYHFDIQVPDISAPHFHIDLKMQILPLADSTELELHTETKFINIKSVTVDGLPFAFSYLKGIPNNPNYGLSGDVLSITDLQLKSGKPQEVIISYDVALGDVKNQAGLFTKDQLGTTILLTRNWPYYGRFWFPANDTPLDSAKVSYKISVPPGYMAVANGALIKQENQDYYWEQSKPTSTYNFIFSIGKFSVYSEDICFDRTGVDNKRVDCAIAQVKIPLQIYYNKDIPWHSDAVDSVKKDVDALIYFSKLFGEYEFEKLGFLISSYPFSMESTSLIVLKNKNSAVHEIAHHWFGNNVVIPHWGDFWISEGFTTYVTGLYDEYLTGKNTSCLDETSPNPLNNPNSTDPNDIFDSIPYCKGAAAIHNLRIELQVLAQQDPKSTEAFLKLLSQLYLDYRGKPMSTEQLIDFVSKNARSTYLASGMAIDETAFNQALQIWSQRWFKK